MKSAASSRPSPAKNRAFDAPGQSFTLSRAKTYLGRLVKQAMSGQPVYIIANHRRFLLQEVPEIEPIPMRPPGYFAHCYTKEEIQEDNRQAKASILAPPKDLE